MTPSGIQREVTIECDPAQLQDVRSLVREMWAGSGLPEPEGRRVVLAVDEAVSSILWHACEMGKKGEIHLRLEISDVCFKATVDDLTNHFDVNALNEEEMQAFLRETRKHRLGVFLMRKVMDEVTYTFRRGFQNELEMVKFLPTPEA